MKKPVVLTVLFAATGLTACQGTKSDSSIPDRPIAFAEIGELALPIGTITSERNAATIAKLRDNGPQVAKLYLDELTRFEGIYGDGVGPAKHNPDYLDCKESFHDVVVRIGGLPIDDDHAALDRLWKSLDHCSAVAKRWSDPAEMATFGKDLQAMTRGSMLVLSYAATASGLDAGPRYYHETQAHLRVD